MSQMELIVLPLEKWFSRSQLIQPVAELVFCSLFGEILKSTLSAPFLPP